MISVSPKSFGVKTAATPSSLSLAASPARDDAADDDRDVVDALLAHPVEHGRDQLHVRAGQDREPDAVHVLGDRGRDDLLRRQPDALVDDLEAGVAGPHRDLLGAVGVAVEPGLADQQPQPAAELLAGPLDVARGPGRAPRRPRRPRPRRTPRSAPGTRRTPRAGRRPTPPSSPRRGPRPASPPSGSSPDLRRLGELRRAPARPRRRRAPSRHAASASTAALLGLRVGGLDRGVQVGGERRRLGGLGSS